MAVIGAGSWGTALALAFARGGRELCLWGRDSAQVRAMAARRENRRYLPGAAFPRTLAAVTSLEAAVAGCRDLLFAVPSPALRETALALAPWLADDARICWASKGFERNTGKLPHQVVREVLGESRPLAVLSGPTFAQEVAAGLPTALTIASSDAPFAADLAVALSGRNVRAYTSDDVVGVEVGGAVKNVLAIGAGLSDGLGFGANTRIAMITRGLVEMTRLGVALGARRETFMGLAGMGDLVLTCTDDLSRNRRLGLALASGKTAAEAEADIRQVVEGVRAAAALHDVAESMGIDMPISHQVYRILYQGASPREAVSALMSRELKPESHY